jgi:lipid-binding SYLF domain-containing protein
LEKFFACAIDRVAASARMWYMKRIFVVTVISVVLLLLWNPPLSWAVTKAKVDDRLENAGLVAKEAIGIRSRIPQLLLNKAYCVIVIPSVLKTSFGFGGSYGRGAMSCRTGEDFKGPWGAPSMMALEGVSFGFQIGGRPQTSCCW